MAVYSRSFQLSALVVIAAALFSTSCSERPEQTASVRWMWSGGVTTTSARIKAKVEEGPTIPLRIAPVSNPSAVRKVAASIQPSGPGAQMADYAVTDLEPDTEYEYSLGGATGRFRTFPGGAASFAIALGSCALTGSEGPVFATIAAHHPLMFLHTGDLHYENIAVNDAQDFRDAYDKALGSKAQSALFRSTATVYMWDDHDYGPNNSDGTSPSREASRMAYREIVPHYPLAENGGTSIQQAFTIGRVRFIVTDMRSERDAPDVPAGHTRTMLGDAQKAWFKAELLAAHKTHALIVWVNSVPWIGNDTSNENLDRWTGFVEERAKIASFIEEHGITNLCMLSGDAHMLAIDDGSNNRYGPSGAPGFPVFQAAALDKGGSVKGGPYSHGTFPGPGQFGLMRVIDGGGPEVTVEWSGRNYEDKELLSHRFVVAAPAVSRP